MSFGACIRTVFLESPLLCFVGQEGTVKGSTSSDIPVLFFKNNYIE